MRLLRRDGALLYNQLLFSCHDSLLGFFFPPQEELERKKAENARRQEDEARRKMDELKKAKEAEEKRREQAGFPFTSSAVA